MQGILCSLDARASKAFQRSKKEKEQVENVNLLMYHSFALYSNCAKVLVREAITSRFSFPRSSSKI
ncbi:MAG: hypothetical protein AAF573_19845 [Bacteroidota bacterium]